MNTTPSSPENKGSRGFLATLLLGLRVLLSEFKWLFVKSLRSFELRQLRKRLRRERSALGLALSEQLKDQREGEPLPAPSPETMLAIKQIRFLNEEIAYLESDRANMRAEFEKRRGEKLGLG